MTPPAYSAQAIADLIAAIRFDSQGLVPVVAQDQETGQVLMLAWMNADSLRLTMTTGAMTYWSRSRQELWRKGATSGHTQALVAMTLDCDGDALLATVVQNGPACHTGAPSCFFKTVG